MKKKKKINIIEEQFKDELNTLLRKYGVSIEFWNSENYLINNQYGDVM